MGMGGMDAMHGSPYGMMPPWWMMPPHMMGQQQQQVSIPDIIVPARVNKAMEFLSLLTQKTSTRAAVNDISIEQIHGQKLSSEELNAQATACNLLSSYFAGKLTPDIWEGIKVDAARKHVENGGIAGRLVHCIACAPNPPSPECPFCRGSGRIMITAMGMPGSGVGSKIADDSDEDDD